MQSTLDYGGAGAGPSQPQAQSLTRAESKGNVERGPIHHEKPHDLHENQDDACNHETACSGKRALWARKATAGPVMPRLCSPIPSVNNGAPSSQHPLVFESREIQLALLQLVAAANSFAFRLLLGFLSWYLFLNGQGHTAIRVDQRCVQHAFDLLIASLRGGDDAACAKRRLQAGAIALRPCAAWEPNEDPGSSGRTARPAGSTHGSSAALPTADRSGGGSRRRPGRPRGRRGRRGSTSEPGGNGGSGGGGGGGAQPNMPRATPDDSRLFACPFFLHPDGSNDCHGYKRLCDVRSHLARRHKQPTHCLQCKLTFERGEDLEQHELNRPARPCSYNDYVHPGITPDQWTDITDRRNRQGTPEERWNNIWRILFPTLPPPFSPYILSPFTSRLQREIAMFQQGGILQNVVNGIVPIGAWYDSQTLSTRVIQCLQAFVEHVERQEGAAPVRASPSDTNVGMAGTRPPLPPADPRPPVPSLSSPGLFRSVPVTFSSLAPTQGLPIFPPYSPESGLSFDNRNALVFDGMYMLGPNDPRESLGEQTRYEIANVIHLDPVLEEDVGEGAPDVWWP